LYIAMNDNTLWSVSSNGVQLEVCLGVVSDADRFVPGQVRFYNSQEECANLPTMEDISYLPQVSETLDVYPPEWTGMYWLTRGNIWKVCNTESENDVSPHITLIAARVRTGGMAWDAVEEKLYFNDGARMMRCNSDGSEMEVAFEGIEPPPNDEQIATPILI